ncbi:MAG: ATP synthase F1 subunit delta [Alphaproteobacteria bacterium]|jgi:F-type H+-transporting ATPase subunit delta|nr:ATP synthase F1 subunit delta [Alphaproteobacteria bacterium]
MSPELLLTSLTSLPGRYAKALFETSKKQSERTETLKNFEVLSSFLKENQELERTLLSSVLNRKRLDEVWIEVGKKMKFLPFFLSFIRLLIKERRLPLFYSIYEKYQMLTCFYNNERKLTVFSASPLIDKEKSDLQKSLLQHFSEKIEMTFVIDESILSGIVVKADTFILDASYRNQLKHLTKTLKG